MITTVTFFLFLSVFLFSFLVIGLVIHKLDWTKCSVLLAGLLLVATSVLYTIHFSDVPIVYHDEDWYLDQSKNYVELESNCRCTYYEKGVCQTCAEQYDHMGLVAFNAFFFDLFGLDEHLLRIVYVALSVLTVLLYFLVVRMIFHLYGKQLLKNIQKSYYPFIAACIAVIWGFLYFFSYYTSSLVPLVPFLFFLGLFFLGSFYLIYQWRQQNRFSTAGTGLFVSVIYLILISIRFESVFLVFSFVFLVLYELFYKQRIRQRTFYLFFAGAVAFFVLCLASINPILRFVMDSIDGASISTNYFGGKEYGTLLSLSLLEQNILENISLFFEYSFMNPLYSLLMVSTVVVLAISLFKRKTNGFALALSLIGLTSFLLFFLFYQLYYQYPLEQFYNERRLVLFFYFLLPVLFCAPLRLLSHSRRYVLLYLILLPLLTVGIELMYEINYEEELMQEHTDAEVLASLAKRTGGIVLTYEPSVFSFHNVSSVSLPSISFQELEELLTTNLKQWRHVYYFDMYASRFYYMYDRYKQFFEENYVVMPNSSRVLYARDAQERYQTIDDISRRPLE